MKAEDYSSSFLAAFLVAFLAGFSSASIEAFSSARAERSPSGLLHLRHLYLRLISFSSAFLARLSRSLFCTSSHVRARTENTLSVTVYPPLPTHSPTLSIRTSLNHLERQFVANIPRAIKKEKKHHPNHQQKKWVLPSIQSEFVLLTVYLSIWFFRLIWCSLRSRLAWSLLGPQE